MELQSDGLMNGTAQSMNQGGSEKSKEQKSKPDETRFSILEPVDKKEELSGIYERPLPCFGCGVGWFCFILGFAFPLIWYIGTALYFAEYYLKDPRERAGLAASAIAALICSVAAFITLIAIHV